MQRATRKVQKSRNVRQKAEGRRQKAGFLVFAPCWLLTVLFFLYAGCARQMPPPGGPPDEIPPRVISTVPADDSVLVALDSVIRIEFSEPMDHQSVERALFMAPQWVQEPQLKWRGNTLEVRLREGLKKDRTYVITVGRESADEWRNRMRASYSFGFATGAQLNRGELNGRVLASKNERGQLFVWGYDLGLVADPDPGVDRPAYVTQPDETGHFALTRLGSGTYRIFAFADRNNDRTYSSGDLLAVPPGDVSLKDEYRIRLGDLKLAARDTSAPDLIAVRTPDQNHVLMRFDETVHIEQIEISNLPVLDMYYDPTDSSGVGVVTESQRAGVDYKISVEVVDPFGNRVVRETSVRGDGTRDRQAPEVMVSEPAINASFVAPNAPIHMRFSDAMRQDQVSDLWIRSDSTFVPEGQFEWAAPNHLIFWPAYLWASRDTVRLIANPERLLDVSGNALLKPILFVFSARDTAALGRMRGTVSSPDFVIWMQSLENDLFLKHVVQDTSFLLTDLVPGQYRVSGFLDLDTNRQWTPGQANPFVPAEPLVSQADTVEVRARWEIEIERLESEVWWIMSPKEERP